MHSAANPTTLIAKHFASMGHSLEDLQVMPIGQFTPKPNESQSSIDQRRRNREEFWIRELGTLDPYGLMTKSNHGVPFPREAKVV